MVDAQTLLREIPDMSTLPELEKDKLNRAAVYKRLRKKEILFLEGEAPAGFCIIESGWIKTYRSSQGGRDVVLDILGPGDTVGSCCGPANGSSSHGCSAAAITQARVLWVKGADWRMLCRECPGLGRVALEVMLRSRRRCVDLAVELALNDVDSRLASLLLKLAGYRNGLSGKRPVAQVISHQDMASAIGTAREVVTRHLARLVEQGVLSREGRRICVDKPEQLQTIARGG